MYQILPPNQNRFSATSGKRNRNRGVVLSEQGWRKLIQADVLHDQWGNRHTYEKLSERSLLNKRTVSRILSCEVRMDKHTLKIFFAAFSLHLDGDDYTTKCRSASQPISLSLYPSLPVHTAEANLSYRELIELYRRLVQDLRQISRLLNLDEVNGSNRSPATELN